MLQKFSIFPAGARRRFGATASISGLALAGLLASVGAHAATFEAEPSFGGRVEVREIPKLLRDDFDGGRFGEQLSIGLDFRRFDYREELEAPLKSTETGLLPGLRVGYYRQSGLGPFFLEGEAGFAGASLHYDGSTQKGQPVEGGNSATLAHFSALAGVRLWSTSGPVASRVRAYAGGSFSYWGRGSGGFLSGTGVIAERETYRRLTLPVGVRIENDLAPDWNLAVDVSVRPAVLGRMSIEFSRFRTGAEDPTVTLGNRVGWRAELPLAWRVARDFVFTFAPWYERKSIGQSEQFRARLSAVRTEVGNEPSSETSELGSTFAMSMRL